MAQQVNTTLASDKHLEHVLTWIQHLQQQPLSTFSEPSLMTRKLVQVRTSQCVEESALINHCHPLAATTTVPTLGTTTAAATTGASTSTAASAITTTAMAPPSALRGKNVEEIVNKWSQDLEAHVREFDKFAGEVHVWDRALMENGNSVRVPATGIPVI